MAVVTNHNAQVKYCTRAASVIGFIFWMADMCIGSSVTLVMDRNFTHTKIVAASKRKLGGFNIGLRTLRILSRFLIASSSLSVLE